MIDEMMKQCCDADGMPNFNKMKQFMEKCGTKHFDEEHIAALKEFCSGEDAPDFQKMKAMMEKCGCQVPGMKAEVSQ